MHIMLKFLFHLIFWCFNSIKDRIGAPGYRNACAKVGQPGQIFQLHLTVTMVVGKQSPVGSSHVMLERPFMHLYLKELTQECCDSL